MNLKRKQKEKKNISKSKIKSHFLRVMNSIFNMMIFYFKRIICPMSADIEADMVYFNKLLPEQTS